jgi:ferredoxin
MAKVIFEGDERELPDGAEVMESCEDLGLPFGCTDGICGTCMSVVKQGADSLLPKTEKEDEFDLPEGQRLVCQCTIKSGTVEFALD